MRKTWKVIWKWARIEGPTAPPTYCWVVGDDGGEHHHGQQEPPISRARVAVELAVPEGEGSPTRRSGGWRRPCRSRSRTGRRRRGRRRRWGRGRRRRRRRRTAGALWTVDAYVLAGTSRGRGSSPTSHRNHCLKPFNPMPPTQRPAPTDEHPSSTLSTPSTCTVTSVPGVRLRNLWTSLPSSPDPIRSPPGELLHDRRDFGNRTANCCWVQNEVGGCDRRPSLRQRTRMVTQALAPRPMTCARPTFAPTTCRPLPRPAAAAPVRPPDPAPRRPAARPWRQPAGGVDGRRPADEGGAGLEDRRLPPGAQDRAPGQASSSRSASVS